MKLEIKSTWLLLSVITISLCDERPEVVTQYGTYRGHVIKSREGNDILAYQGVPYAQPPVGKLRYKDPQKLEKCDGVFDANKEIICIQTIKYVESYKDTNLTYFGNEDCLYLNVYVPKKEVKELLPVYVFIHGGSFIIGSGTEIWTSPINLVDRERDMIMVTLNYRLGVLGFLSANDDTLPGNFGLKDQTMALRWVKENIEAFGGNPNSVTLGGISAGAACVSHHLYSKASRGLFHRAVSQGGTADCSWATKPTNEAREVSSKIISILGCPSEPEELLKCLQELPADTIINSMDKIEMPQATGVIYMTPVVEKDSPTAFMTRESILEGSDVPWISGITNEEGLLFYHYLLEGEPKYEDLSILKSDGDKLLPLVAYYKSNPNPGKITQELKDYYFQDKGFSKDTDKNFVQLLSDLMFNHGFHKATRRYKGKLYQYMLSYRGQYTAATRRPKELENKVGHGEDVFYFFPRFMSIPEWNIKGKDLEIANTLMDMWYRFIKFGDPHPETHLWEESEGGKKYLDITNDGLVMASDMFKERNEYLDKLNILPPLEDY